DQGSGPAVITTSYGNGTLKIDGDNTNIASGANTSGGHPLFGELHVVGNVNWARGTYRPHLDAEGPDEDPNLESYFDGDLWTVTGTVTGGANAKLGPVGLGRDNPMLTP